MPTPRRQITVVAFHGPKPDALAALLGRLVTDVAEACGDEFAPYAPEQIHGTLLGLETVDSPAGPALNRNFLEHHGESRVMDLGPLARDIRDAVRGLRVRFGGFQPDDAPFTSRGERPHDRGFSIQGDRAVLIGWPAEGPPWRFPDSLDRLRRAARAHGASHAYHRGPTDRDNDLYLRLGLFRHVPAAPERARVEQRGRRLLAGHAPVSIPLGATDVRIVAYDDPTLPPERTRSWPLEDLDLSPAGVARLVRDAGID